MSWKSILTRVLLQSNYAAILTKKRFSFAYRQKVGTEDMFLGMSGRTPSLRHSDDLIVTIQLPKINFKELHLTVLKDRLDLRCPTLYVI